MQRLAAIALLAIVASSSTPAAATEPTPAIKPATAFAVPLADNSTGTAFLLPTQTAQAVLIIANPAGQACVYTIAPQPPTPLPPVPPPVPPVPPVPPTPTKLSIVIIEDATKTTVQQESVLTAKAWRDLATARHNFLGIYDAKIIDRRTGQPPAVLLPFLHDATGQQLPWVMFADANGKLIYHGTLPATAEAMTSLIKYFGG